MVMDVCLSPRQDVHQDVVHEALQLGEALHAIEQGLIDVAPRGEHGVASSSTRLAHVASIVLAIAVVLIWFGRIYNVVNVRRPVILWGPICLEPVRETTPADLARDGLQAIPVCEVLGRVPRFNRTAYR